MGTPGPEPDVTLGETLGVFVESDRPRAPRTASEVADALGCSRRTAHRKLEELADRGDLHSKKTGARSRVWWRSDGADGSDGEGDEPSELEQFGEFVRAVEDYAIFMLDPDGTVASWNEGAARLKGYDREQIVGSHFSAFYTDEAAEAGVPDRNLEAATREGRVETEGWRVREDGSEFWANVVITAIRDDDGNLRGFTKVTQDLTERHEHERELERERDFSRQVLETVPVGVTVIEPDGQFVRANSRALDRLGIDEDDLEDHSPDSWPLYDEDDERVPEAETPWARAAESSKPVYDFRCRIDLPELGRRWLSINAAPLSDDGDGRIVIAVEDVTEQVDRERELRRERNQTEQLLRTAPIAVTVRGADGEPLQANRRAQELLGVSEEGLDVDEARESDRELYGADGEPMGIAETPTARALSTGEPVYEKEMAVEAPDGERTWFSVSATPITDEDGELTRVITAAEEITELKRRERELARQKGELETELSEILGRVSDAFYALDEDWRFTHVNERAATLLRRPMAELLGEALWEAFPQSRDSDLGDRFREAMETQEAASFEIPHPEEDMWLEMNAYPSETGLSVYFQDVTERVERERELERYRTIVETVEDGIYIVNPDGEFTMVNEAYAEMTGYAREDLLGSHVSLVVDEDTIQSAGDLERDLLEDEETPAKLQADLLRADGSAVPAEASFSLLDTDDGYQRVAVVRDVSERVGRERELRRKERRFQAVFEDPNILVGLLEPDGTVLDINQTAMEYIDVDLEAVTGEPFWETPWWGEGEHVRADVEEWTRRAAEGKYVEFQADLTRPDGERYVLEGYFRPVTDDDGEVVSIVVSDRDVTERRRREQELAESERLYRTFVDNFPNGAVGLVDQDLTYQAIGGRTMDTGGVTPEEATGSRVAEVLPEAVAEKLVPCYEAAFDGESSAFELERDGRFFQFRIIPVRDDDGNFFAAMEMSQEFTDRKEYERRLEESERRYRALVENFPDGAVGLFDEELRYTAVGGDLLEATGVDPSDRVGSKVAEIYPAELVDSVEPHFRAALEGESRTFEEEFHDRHLLAHTHPVTDDDGEIFAGMLVVQDVTERREYERELERSNERLEQFAYVASHDLQEPLRMVSNYLQLLDRRFADDLDEEAREFIDFAVDGADRMREMINDLLAYSRVETDPDPFEPTDADAVVDRVLDQLRFRIDETDADVAVGDLPTVVADENQLEQVFQNLVSNAIKYAGDEPPRVEIGGEERDGEWVFHVADEGIGIDSEYQDRIFDVFDRLHTTEEYSGTGIGLALCERIVERHDGRIWVESEAGEGSTFYFAIPKGDQE